MTLEQYYHLITKRSERWAERFFPRSVRHLLMYEARQGREMTYKDDIK